MKNIFFLNSCQEWGGGEKWTFETAQELAKRGYEATIGSIEESELFNRAQKEGIRTKIVPVSGSLSVLNPFKLFSFVKYLKEHKIKVIFLNLSQDLKFGAIAARLAGVEKIIYRRGLEIPIKDRLYTKFLFKYCLTDIIANSHAIKSTILQNTSKWLSKDKIKIVYNGIKLDEIEDKIKLKSDIRKEYNIKQDTTLIASVGRLSEQKGHCYLLKAINLVKKEIKDFKVLIVGKGELENELRQQVKDLNLSDNIIFTGFREDVFSILYQVDFLVHTAMWEGCPNIILETMAVATPIVATNISSVSETMINNETGYLAKSKNPEDIAEKVIKMIKSSGKEQMGQRGRKLVEDKFYFKNKIDQLEELYLN